MFPFVAGFVDEATGIVEQASMKKFTLCDSTWLVLQMDTRVLKLKMMRAKKR